MAWYDVRLYSKYSKAISNPKFDSNLPLDIFLEDDVLVLLPECVSNNDLKIYVDKNGFEYVYYGTLEALKAKYPNHSYLDEYFKNSNYFYENGYARKEDLRGLLKIIDSSKKEPIYSFFIFNDFYFIINYTYTDNIVDYYRNLHFEQNKGKKFDEKISFDDLGKNYLFEFNALYSDDMSVFYSFSGDTEHCLFRKYPGSLTFAQYSDVRSDFYYSKDEMAYNKFTDEVVLFCEGMFLDVVYSSDGKFAVPTLLYNKLLKEKESTTISSNGNNQTCSSNGNNQTCDNSFDFQSLDSNHNSLPDGVKVKLRHNGRVYTIVKSFILLNSDYNYIVCYYLKDDGGKILFVPDIYVTRI